ncbi:MAG: zinc-binding dehydrogenase [Petrimonas sp.]|nr:zinc-binding dehydrogenase [Petrimonas sp.]
MKAVRVCGEKKTEIIEVDKPVVKPDEVLIKVFGCMLCTFEQRVFKGMLPFLLPFVGGHEFAGVIEAVGANVRKEDYPIGARCSAAILTACGECDACKRGDDGVCMHINDPEVTAGKNGLAEYITVKSKSVYIFPDDVPYERIMFTEPLACVISAHDKIDIQLEDHVLVLGAGIMGVMLAKIAKMRGAHVTVSDPVAERREAVKKLGFCDEVIDPTEKDFIQVGRKIAAPRGFNAVINTVAIPAVIDQGLDLLAPGGSFLMYGKVFPNEKVPIDINRIHDNEMKIFGTMSGDIRSFYRAAKVLAVGDFCPEKMGLISLLIDMEDAQRAYEEAMNPANFRIGIKFADL